MDDFHVRSGRLFAEDVSLDALAERCGTPLYVYSKRTIVGHFRRVRDAYAPAGVHLGYAVKANSNLAILKVLADEGARFDVVSAGEIYRVLQAGAPADRIDFEGPGKRRDEIEYALDAGVHMFNVESEAEVDLLDACARDKGTIARVSLRVNPDVDPQTHTYITTGKKENKFGLDFERARKLAGATQAKKGVRLCGVHAHIGSQITKIEPHVEMVGRLLGLATELRARHEGIESVNIGGGFGIHYHEHEAPEIGQFADQLVPLLKDCGFRVHMEPGRLVVGNAGILLTRVTYVKRGGEKRFVICDAGMNDLIRPSLYSAFHRVEPVAARPGGPSPADVVGPICESGDFLAKDRELPPLEPGDLLAIRSAGAYGFVMASNYNTRPRAAEVMVDGDRYAVVRERETWKDLVRGEHADPEWATP
jgi:diaminopimelate decarboxylase